jgi:predicted MFS family arabinose efflux permease
MERLKDKKERDRIDIVIILALVITGIMITLQYLKPIIESKSILFEFFTLIIFGIGGVGVGVILAGLYIRSIEILNKHKGE